jgi:PAS domain S-box-containing protein
MFLESDDSLEKSSAETRKTAVPNFTPSISDQLVEHFSLPRRKALLAALVVMALSCAVWGGAHFWYRDSLLLAKRGEVLAGLDPYGNALVIDLRRRLDIIYGLSAWVNTHSGPADLAVKFEPFARQLQGDISGVRNLTIAPGGVRPFVYPPARSAAVVDHDVDDSRPEVRADVARAVESRKIVISGPYQRQLGELAVVARLAIHRDNNFWGLVSVAVDLPPILQEAGIAKTGRLELALRDSQNRVFFGPAAVFDAGPVIHEVSLPDGRWELAAVPATGWKASIQRDLRIFDGAMLVVVFLLSAFTYLVAFRDARLADGIDRRTREINEARELLEKSEERYHRLVDLNPDAVLVNFQGMIVYANNAARQLLGASRPEEILGRSPLDFIEPHMRAEIKARIRTVLDTGRRHPSTYQRRVRLDGSMVEVETVAAPLAWEGGTAIQVIMRDVTEQRSAEASLQGLIDATQDAVISIDRDARIVVFNPAAESIFGYAKDEVKGQKVNMLMAEPYATEHDDYLARYEKTGEPKAIGRIRTLAGRRKNGENFPLELSVTKIAAGGNVNYAAFIRDITEKTKLQSQLVERERLAAIGATSAKFAHEIGNPLNGMYMSAQLLERRLESAGVSDEKVLSIFQTIVGEMKRLSVLLSEFRSLYRQERYNFRPTSLPAIVTDILNLERPNYIRRGIHIEQFFAADLPSVTADGDKLKQVLLNLCNNAVDAMPEGGTLAVRAAMHGKAAIVEVRDTGVGVPQTIDIWEPFATTKTSGTGLGLVIVRQIIAAHHGTITHRSEAGKGTTFTITLPLE